MRVKEAKKILPKNEFEAFEAILMNQISRTDNKKLMQRATLARKLRDKYRDLARSQVNAVRERKTNTIDTRLVDRKAQIFQDIIDRLEEELDAPRRQNAATKEASAQKKKRRRMANSEQEISREQMRSLHEAKRRTRDVRVDE